MKNTNCPHFNNETFTYPLHDFGNVVRVCANQFELLLPNKALTAMRYPATPHTRFFSLTVGAFRIRLKVVDQRQVS